jgi:hypothetical protein
VRRHLTTNRRSFGFVPTHLSKALHCENLAISDMLRSLNAGMLNVLKALSIKAIHSSRSSITGSTDSARRAGIHVATSPNNNIARTTPAKTSGSRGVA